MILASKNLGEEGARAPCLHTSRPCLRIQFKSVFTYDNFTSTVHVGV